MLEQYKKVTVLSEDAADDYFEDKVSSLLREVELLNQLLQEKDTAIKQRDVFGKEKEELLNQLLQAKDVVISEKDHEVVAGRGLLTSRRVMEAVPRKCLIEMKALRLVKDKEKDDMTSIITLVTQKETHPPETSK